MNKIFQSLDLLYVPSIMQRQLIGHNSLHNSLVAYVEDIKPIKMYNVTIKILILKLLQSQSSNHTWSLHRSTSYSPSMTDLPWLSSTENSELNSLRRLSLRKLLCTDPTENIVSHCCLCSCLQSCCLATRWSNPLQYLPNYTASHSRKQYNLHSHHMITSSLTMGKL
jgi:hypothetical protein